MVSILSLEEGGDVMVAVEEEEEEEDEEGRVVVDEETVPLASRIRVRSLFIRMAFCMSKFVGPLGPDWRARWAGKKRQASANLVLCNKTRHYAKRPTIIPTSVLTLAGLLTDGLLLIRGSISCRLAPTRTADEDAPTIWFSS